MEAGHPIITYKKWWHRFSPYHRRMIKLLQTFTDYNWAHGMKEEVEAETHKHTMELLKFGRTKIGDKWFYY